MRENIECEDCNLIKIVTECLKNVESCLKEECMDVGLKEITEKLNELTPSLSVILSKWTPQIIYSLYLRKAMGFNELKRALKVSSRVLSDKLRVLEERRIIFRTVKPEKPPKVLYRLTSAGEKIALALIPMLIVVRLIR